MAAEISHTNFIEIPEREKEKLQLLNFLKNSVNTFVYGPYGIGKTTLIKSVIEEYNDKIGEAIYIDCLLYRTTNAVLREILFSLGSLIASKSNYELIKRLKQKTKKSKPVILLDHFEYLKDVEILSIILSLNLHVYVISDVFESYKRMSLALRSNIANVMKMNEYSKDEVLEILKEKVSCASYKCSIRDELLQEIVQKCGSNLTLAWSLLETVISTAKNQRKRSVEHINLSDIDSSNETLHEDYEIILQILRQLGRLPSGKLYKLYCGVSKHPKSERSFRKYVKDLAKQGLVKSIGEKRGRSYEIIERAPD